MADTFKKIDPQTVERTRRMATVTVSQHTLEFLTVQRETIQDQKDRDNAQRDLELAEVDALLDALSSK